LFAHLDSALAHIPGAEVAGDVSWSPPPDGNAALVLDMPGSEGVLAGVALASRGYRPVPLYNALPLPFGERLFDPLTGRAVAGLTDRGFRVLVHARVPCNDGGISFGQAAVAAATVT